MRCREQGTMEKATQVTRDALKSRHLPLTAAACTRRSDRPMPVTLRRQDLSSAGILSKAPALLRRWGDDDRVSGEGRAEAAYAPLLRSAHRADPVRRMDAGPRVGPDRFAWNGAARLV